MEVVEAWDGELKEGRESVGGNGDAGDGVGRVRGSGRSGVDVREASGARERVEGSVVIAGGKKIRCAGEFCS